MADAIDDGDFEECGRLADAGNWPLVKLHLLLRHAVARPMRYRDFCLAVRL
jgi:hypothetical protein